MFYRVQSVFVGETSVRACVELVEKNDLFTEVVRTLTFNIPISEGRTVFNDEVSPMVEQVLKDAGIEVEGRDSV